MNDIFFQIILFLAGAFIGVIAQLIQGFPRFLKVMATLLGVLLVAFSAVWLGYNLGYSQAQTTVSASNATRTASASIGAPTSNPTANSQPQQSSNSNSTQPSATTRVTLPFTDNFDNGVSNVCIREGGDWQMENGRLVNKGSNGVLWLGKADWTDVSIEVDAITDNCAGDVEVLVRMKDPENYAAVRRSPYCNFRAATVALYLFKNGKLQKQMVGGLPDGTHLKLEVIGNVYKVYIDGKLQGTATDDNFSSGSVGFTINGTGGVDNFSVRPYIPDSPSTHKPAPAGLHSFIHKTFHPNDSQPASSTAEKISVADIIPIAAPSSSMTGI